MYTSFTAKNFRCFKHLTIEPLGQINLIAGKNNVGKTALLEALFLHSGAYNPALILKVDAFRGIEAVQFNLTEWASLPWASIFWQFDTSKTIELVGENTHTGQRWLWLREADRSQIPTSSVQPPLIPPSDVEAAQLSLDATPALQLEFQELDRSSKIYLVADRSGIRSVPPPPGPPFPAVYYGARFRLPAVQEAERFGRLELQGRQDVLLRTLWHIEPRLKRLAMVIVAGQPVLHGDIGLSRLVPLPLMGGGVERVASLVLGIANTPDGVVFVDEIENGLHYSVLQSLWEAIGSVAQEFNTQIFATTHSFECIKAAQKAFEGGEENDFRYHRLDRRDAQIHAVTFTKRQLATAIKTDLEPR